MTVGAAGLSRAACWDVLPRQRALCLHTFLQLRGGAFTAPGCTGGGHRQQLGGHGGTPPRMSRRTGRGCRCAKRDFLRLKVNAELQTRAERRLSHADVLGPQLPCSLSPGWLRCSSSTRSCRKDQSTFSRCSSSPHFFRKVHRTLSRCSSSTRSCRKDQSTFSRCSSSPHFFRKVHRTLSRCSSSPHFFRKVHRTLSRQDQRWTNSTAAREN
ncbi:hypothetical protein CesoFtcFv8_006769 [Champsocephalus esox]|uniref:Uncharacterized protein n=1 Tax=Champsocephalus esox TaxID=159716 RepID=A0AAN8HAA3_9TELE|nr:hypothetical protein CesoFtcFv8_006769 [Champsocephalus esox]